MKIAFEILSPNARIWIYQADRDLSEVECETIKAKLDLFLPQWTAHKQELACSGDLFHKRFLVLGVDESLNAVSGCSIDSSVHFVKQLENQLNINFFNRSLVPFLVGEKVETYPINRLKDLIGEGIINKETPTFNNLLDRKEVFEEKWLVPAGETWLNRYFA
jgi:hypothetical protein